MCNAHTYFIIGRQFLTNDCDPVSMFGSLLGIAVWAVVSIVVILCAGVRYGKSERAGR